MFCGGKARSYRGRVLLAFVLAWPLFAFGLEPVKVAPDIYAFIGDAGAISANNRGFVGNAGFIVARDGIIVIDSGASYRFAIEMLAAIRQISAKPIRLLVLTHPAQEFIFGAGLFMAHDVPVLAHRKSAELMRARCDVCLKNLRAILGAASMKDTEVITPDRTIEASQTLQIAGRTIDLLHFGWGSTAGDLVVFDRQSGVAFAGGLVSNGRVPDLRDADFNGWLTALDGLAGLPLRLVVAGFGPPAKPSSIDKTRQYLLSLRQAVQRRYRSGMSLLEAPRQTPLPAFSRWKQYANLHPRNVHQIYLQLEQAEFDR